MRPLASMVTSSSWAERSSWPSHSGMGDVYKDDEWYEEALNLYRKASELQPLAFPPRFGEAIIYHRVRYIPHAIRLFQKLMKEFPDSDNLVLLGAAATHMSANEFGPALQELEQVAFGGRRGLCYGSALYRIGLCR